MALSRSVRDNFSSRGKSSLQLLRKKMRKTGCKVKVKEGNDSEELEEVCKNAKKVRKRFWSKWLSFVRRRWSGNGPFRSQVGSKSVAGTLQSVGTTIGSNATSMDIIEIPIEPGQNISKILIKPTRTGIKAMIAQSRSPICSKRTPRENKWPPSENSSWRGRSPGLSETELSEERGRSHDRSTSWNAKVFKKETEMTASKDTMLTSALFFREDLDNIVESAVFIEPKLPNDYPLSRKSDDLSQKSIKINKKRVSYRILDERKDDFLKTIKTISEPSWMERENILRRKRLHDNINNLLEQFMFLESDDVVGLTIPRSKPTQDRKTIQFNGPSSQVVGGLPYKEISREVSPEILVNKKPFKEYLPDDYLGAGQSKSQKSIGGLSRKGKKLKAGKESDGPILNEVFHSKERNHGDAYSGVRSGIQRITTMEREMTRTCYGDCEELSEVASLRCVESEDSPMCTIWGVCKTYSACNRTSEEGAAPADESRKKTGKESLDELLDRLDDSDHDAVFQKNIAQFRKKVNVVPRLEMRKPKDAKRTEHKKMKRSQSCLEPPVKPIIECVVEESEEEEQDDMRKSIAVSKVSFLEKYAETEKLRVFGRNFMLRTVRSTARRALANRTEEATVKILPRLREVYSLVESSRCTVVQRERATTSIFTEVYLTCKRSRPVVPRSSGKVELKNLNTISLILGGQDDDFNAFQENELAVSQEDIPQALPLFSSTTECFYVIQTPPSFSGAQQLSGCNPMDLTLSGESKSKVELREEGRDQISRTSNLNVIKLSELEDIEPDSGLQTVRIPSSDVFDLYDRLEAPLQGHQECGVTEDRIEITSVEGIASENSRTADDLEIQDNLRVDGFQILYNNEKEDLNDDEDEAMKSNSIKNLCERAQNITYIVEEIEEKEEKEEEEKNQKEEDAEKEEVNSDKSETVTKIAENNLARFLKFKSSSSPKESIPQSELAPQDHRTRRSLVLLKEPEKDLHSKKRRLSGDKSLEVRRTGSALPKQDVSFLENKPSFGGNKQFPGLVLPEELKTNPDRQCKTLDMKKMLDMDGRPNMRKEVIAAFNSIKELSHSCKAEVKGGNKRMSLVIMFSKK